MGFQLASQVYLKHDETSNSYYLFCLEDGRHFRLNETGYEIVKMVQVGKTKDEIAKLISETYNVVIDSCTEDIDELFDFLLINNLLNK